MKNEQELFDISTRLLKDTLTPLATIEDVAPAEMVALLFITLGRIVGRMGYRHMSKDVYWKELTENGESLYALGFKTERFGRDHHV